MPYKIISHISKKKIAIAIASLIISGCSVVEEKPVIDIPVFPPPPAEARYVYEASLRSSNSIAEPSFGDRIREAATGTQIVPSGLAKPYGVAARNGRIYVTDTQQRAIVLFDLNDKAVKLLGTEGPGTLQKPLGIDISKDNEIFVADNTAKRIVVFDMAGNFLRTFGSQQYFERPVGVATDPLSDKVYVVDTGGIESEQHHIVVFNGKTGEYLSTIGTRGKGAEEFNIPLQISVANDGTIYIADSGNFRIQRISKEGKFIGSFGSIGRLTGQFSRPKGVATDNEGNVYVVDTAFGNVQIFNPAAELLLFIGERDTSGGPAKFSLPAGIDVDENGKIYIVDQFFRKVDIIRPINAKPFEVFEN